MARVKAQRRKGHTRLSAKNQATMPVDALRRAGLKPGDALRVEAVGPGRIVLVPAGDPIKRFAGCLTGAYPRGYLRAIRRNGASRHRRQRGHRVRRCG
jgi:bifunctional DNA-binding transcriptional regulator/antitoxin component of YhaV-PrlF toxin-antitoxin module